MADLTVGRVYMARRIGYRGGKPLFKIAQPCDDDDGTLDFDAGAVHMWRREGSKSSKPIGRAMSAVCDENGDLIVGNVYPAKRIGYKGGKPLYKIACIQCGEMTPTFCDCEICCTLEATVQFGDTTTGGSWGSPVDATLNCGGSFVISNFYVCSLIEIPEDPPICVQFDQTWSGGSGSYVIGPKTFNWTTTIWVSESTTGGPTEMYGGITFTGNFKVYFAATEYLITQDGEDDIICCQYEWGLLVEYTNTGEFTPCPGATGWGFWKRRAFSFGDCSEGVHFVYETCPDFDNECCPDGYFNNTPDSSFLDFVCQGNVVPYIESNVVSETGCVFFEPGDPVLIDDELRYRLIADPDDDAHRIKCAKFTIADLCE